MKLSNKVALVTGSTSGIGAATAMALAAEDAHVIVSGRDRQRGEKVIDTISAAGGSAEFIPVELNGASSSLALAQQATALKGRIDILVNNAGIGAFGPTAETTEDAFDEMYAINVKVPFFLVGAVAPAMAARGDGAIVNLTTMVAGFGQAGAALYGSGKAAISLLTKAWAAEFGPSGVRVNAVSPGPTRTEGTEFMGEALDQLAASAPAGRPATPAEIAAAVVFLAGPWASFVQGTILHVDGGRGAI
jgi:NAD(P)-dependent dehydrogenase (short-subunit alcohol dehydrogenase family)